MGSKEDYDSDFQYKEKGNAAYKNGIQSYNDDRASAIIHFKNALKYYSQILSYLGMNSQMSLRQVCTNNGGANPYRQSTRTSLQKKIDDLRLVAFNNMAAVYLKTEKYEQAIHKTTRVLDETFDKKALFRRGTAYRKTNQLYKALEDLQRASRSMGMQSSDAAINRELSLVQQQLQKQQNSNK